MKLNRWTLRNRYAHDLVLMDCLDGLRLMRCPHCGIEGKTSLSANKRTEGVGCLGNRIISVTNCKEKIHRVLKRQIREGKSKRKTVNTFYHGENRIPVDALAAIVISPAPVPVRAEEVLSWDH